MAKLRTKQQIAERVVALVACHRRAHLHRRAEIERDLGRECLDVLTPRERAFYRAKKPAFRERAERSWGIEAAVVLLWVIGLGPGRLSGLGKVSPAKPACDLAKELKTAGLARVAAGRSFSIVAEALEKTERAHWRIRNARVKGLGPPKGLSFELVFTRHQALNWVTRFCDEDWDDVTTDT